MQFIKCSLSNAVYQLQSCYSQIKFTVVYQMKFTTIPKEVQERSLLLRFIKFGLPNEVFQSKPHAVYKMHFKKSKKM